MSLQILIGHEKPGQRGTATALYVGNSGADLQLAKATAGPTIGSFTILNNPLGLRKSNSTYDPNAKAAVATSAPSAPVEIPEDISGLKKPELVAALVAAIARIKSLEEAAAQAHAAAEAAAQALAAAEAAALAAQETAISTVAAS